MPGHNNNNNWIFVFFFQLIFHSIFLSRKFNVCLWIIVIIIISLFSFFFLSFYESARWNDFQPRNGVHLSEHAVQMIQNAKNWTNSIMHNNLLWDFSNIGGLHCMKNKFVWICLWRGKNEIEFQTANRIHD